MVSAADAELNGWAVGSTVPFAERLDPALFDEMGEGELTVVGVYGRPRRGTGSTPRSPAGPGP